MNKSENYYKVLARAEIDRDIEILEERNKIATQDNIDELVRYADIVRVRLEFATRLQLIEIAKQQEYAEKINKLNLERLKKERKETFKQLVINPNDDTVTPREMLYQSRQNEKLSMDKWKDMIEEQKQNNTNQSKNSNSENENEERRR